ncbi:autotransporter assembly complex protein TamA [Paraferrimonas haliotis]|uniref:autotransporter assembly complex protein TamA n=1 Tax=Paraferrimonas haliotis TaxID=2013866 RepID=UPI000BA98220|nr:autotransporter assembly complex family protein [Paraferrimonas haliotis]
MIFRTALLLAASLTLVSIAVSADENLEVVINGANDALTANIRAHLGELPEDADERSSYLFSVKSNITKAFESLGYYHASYTESLQESEDEWQLTLNVTPGERITIKYIDLQVLGDGVEDSAFNDYLQKAKLSPGQGLNHGRYESFKSDFQSLSLSRGYFDGRFTRTEIEVNRDINEAIIHLTYDSGQRYTLGEVTFIGSPVDVELLQTLIPFEPGAPYSSTGISQLNRSLLETGYFANIKVIPQIDKASNRQVPVKVDLTQRPHNHTFNVGVGASTDTGPRIRLTWRTPVINHYGHHQETSIEYSNRPKFQSVYTIPLTHALDDQLKISAELQRNKYGLIQTFDDQSQEFEGSKQLESDYYRLGVFRQKRWNNAWIFSYGIAGSKENYTQQGDSRVGTFITPGVTLSQTKRGDASLDPKSGYRQSYTLSAGDPALGSDVRIARLTSSFKFIETFFSNHRFVARADLGANIVDDNDLPSVIPSLRFFAGGDNSIRGFNYNELGPRVDSVNDDGVAVKETVGGRYLAVASVEYQYYWNESWRSALFVDSGNAFNNTDFTPVTSAGTGIHWITPIGPIKLDVGVGVAGVDDRKSRPWRIHISIGSEL